ncbi:MAG: ComEA family DNA-binding protein [Lachnospiraceae bacterium]|nr:ComEA family DNA-binding protein [Lachnospiraceae bacterium]
MKSFFIQRNVRFFAWMGIWVWIACLLTACGERGRDLAQITAEESTIGDTEETSLSTDTTEVLSVTGTASNQERSSTNQEKQTTESETKRCVVHVCGAVASPGVYELEADARAGDAVLAAGGLLADAEECAINLAAPLTDGMQLWIPTKEEAAAGRISGSGKNAGSQCDAGGQGNDAGTGAQNSMDADGRININTASREELCTLPGIGETRAESIIAYRTEHGAFQSIEEIKQVSGIKDGTYAQICELICI